MSKCRQCGGCCRALFPVELVDSEDIERFGKEALEYKDGGCEYLEGNKCSIHETKPKVCKEFYCDTHPLKKEKIKKFMEENKNGC